MKMKNCSPNPSITFDIRSWRCINNATGNCRRMAGAQHRGKRLSPLFAIEFARCERPDSAAAREHQSSLHCLRFDRRSHICGIRFVDTCGGQSLRDAPRAVAATSEGRATRLGKGSIVDIFEFGQPRDDRRDGRFASPLPTALLELAAQVIRNARTGCCVAADVGQRERLQRSKIERPRRAPFMSNSEVA